MTNTTILYRVPISEKLAKIFTIKRGFNRLSKNKEYLTVAQIGRISSRIYFNSCWIYELQRTIRI